VGVDVDMVVDLDGDLNVARRRWLVDALTRGAA
jgi:hypothetical protein